MSAGGELTSDQTCTLQRHIEALLLSLQSLAVLLVREREALSRGCNSDALEAITRDKEATVDRVGSLYVLLRESLSPLVRGDSSIAQAVGVLERSHPALAQRVGQLLDLTRRCQRANQDNGVLLREGLARPGESRPPRHPGTALAAFF
jgi:flagellar biosynthesis/type III secretory pathway chaperone